MAVSPSLAVGVAILRDDYILDTSESKSDLNTGTATYQSTVSEIRHKSSSKRKKETHLELKKNICVT